MKNKIAFLILRIARHVYKNIPISASLKVRIDNKLILLIAKFLPGTFSLANNKIDASINFNITNYDAYYDKVGSVLLQNMYFPKDLESAENIMIILVPYHNVISGGIYSMFSIAEVATKMKSKHGWNVLVMTYPNPSGLTYFKNKNFKNSINVFRFSQITRLIKSKYIYIHIPELFSASFLNDINIEQKHFLTAKNSVYVNILNQNIDLMPQSNQLLNLKNTFDKVGHSVAHHAYFSKSIVNKYKLDLHLLPAYTDLTMYLSLPLHKKEKLIIYSPDKASYKNKCISILKDSLSDFKFVEIRDITFDTYIDLASRCMFSITFGEGFDGYLSQPMQLGGVGFAVYNDRFFPNSKFHKLYNIFDNKEMMLRDLPIRIKKLLAHPKLYKSTNLKFLDLHNKLYDKKNYDLQILKLCNLDYDLKFKEN